MGFIVQMIAAFLRLVDECVLDSHLMQIDTAANHQHKIGRQLGKLGIVSRPSGPLECVAGFPHLLHVNGDFPRMD